MTDDAVQQARRPGRPERLAREEILDAAEGIVAAEGIEALTMRRVARELDSSTMAIYRHVRDKSELHLLLVDRLVARVEVPALPEDPVARIVVLWTALRDGLATDAWVIDTLSRGNLIAPGVMDLLEQMHDALLAAGMDLEHAVPAFRILCQFTVGELLMRSRSPGVDVIDEAAASAHPPQPERDPSRHPTLARAGRLWDAERGKEHYRRDLVRLVEALVIRAAR